MTFKYVDKSKKNVLPLKTCYSCYIVRPLKNIDVVYRMITIMIISYMKRVSLVEMNHMTHFIIFDTLNMANITDVMKL